MKIFIAIISIFLIYTTSFTQEVVSLKLGSCNSSSDPYFMHPNRLISKSVKNDTLELVIGIVRNCHFVPQVHLEKRNDSLIIDVQNESNLFASCMCCYVLNIQVAGIKDTSFSLIRKYEANDWTNKGLIEWTEYTEIKTQPNKFVLPTQQEITSFKAENLFYQDSLKIGYWDKYYENSNQLMAKICYFIDSKGKSRTKWRVLYNKEGEVIEICGYSGVSSDGLTDVLCAEYNEYLELQIVEP